MFHKTFGLRYGIILATGLALAGCYSSTSEKPESNSEQRAGNTPQQPTKKEQPVKPAAPQSLDKPMRHVLATNAIQPHVAVNAQGNIYVAFIREGNIVVAASTDGGNTFGEPVVAIDVKGHARGGRQRGPRIGVDDHTIVVTAPVTFDPLQWKKRYPRADLYLVTSNDGGKSWSQPVRVNEEPKKAPEALHWLAVTPSGEAHVAWLDIRNRPQGGQDIFYAKIVKGKVGENTPIAQTVCECCAPGIAVDGQSNPFVGFREGGQKDSREIFVLHSSDQGQSFGKQIQINQAPSQEFG